MAATGSVRIVKKFTYRGAVVNFSNRYFFTGHTPSGSTEWGAFTDAIVTAEKAIYKAFAGGGAMILEAVGYGIGSEVPVFTKSYTTDGTLSPSSWEPVPGDCAAIIRYATAARSSKNHPIYMFNYYHSIGAISGGTTADTLATEQRTAMQTYGDAWVNGISDGTNFYSRTSPAGHNATGYTVPTLITHRDLPR